MNSSSRGSVTTWLDALKDQPEDAARELWNRYFAELTALAQRRLRAFSRDVDGEDVALSALKSAMLGVRNNRFPELNDRTGLWPLLVTITARKSVNEIKRQRALKRGRAREAPLPDVSSVIGSQPSPDFALQVSEALDSLVMALGDETLRTIAQRKLEGYSNEEIASELDVSPRTIVRKLARIRQEWEETA
jgi:RNA polymerase sigma factor (sigma-70 family)